MKKKEQNKKRFPVLTVIFCVLILGASFIASAQSDRVIDPKSITFKMEFFEAPSLPTTGGIQVTSSSGLKWLTAMITYVPTLNYEESRRSNAKQFRWLGTADMLCSPENRFSGVCRRMDRPTGRFLRFPRRF